MSGKILNSLPSPPTWENICEQKLSYKKVDDSLTQKIKRLLKKELQFYKIDHTSINNNLQHFIMEENQKKFFVKVVDKFEHKKLKTSDTLSIELKNLDISVYNFIKKYSIKIEDNKFMHVYNYIDGRFSQCTPSDIKHIAIELSRLHDALRKIKSIKKIKKFTKKREFFLRKDFDKKVDSLSKVNQQASLFLQQDKEILFKRISCKQVIHGDLNYQNIMFRANKKPIFLDFEYSRHSFYSPLYDIAKTIERFILLQSIPDKLKIKLGRVFIKNLTFKRYNFKELYDMLIYISLHSLLILSNNIYINNHIDENEIKKFVSHLYYLKQNKILIQKIIKKEYSEV